MFTGMLVTGGTTGIAGVFPPALYLLAPGTGNAAFPKFLTMPGRCFGEPMAFMKNYFHSQPQQGQTKKRRCNQNQL